VISTTTLLIQRRSHSREKDTRKTGEFWRECPTFQREKPIRKIDKGNSLGDQFNFGIEMRRRGPVSHFSFIRWATEDISVFEVGFFGFEQLDEGCGAAVSKGFVVGEVAVAEVEVIAKEGGPGSPEEEEVW